MPGAEFSAALGAARQQSHAALLSENEGLERMGKKREICVVIGSVPVKNDALKKLDRARCFIICADGGYDNAVRYGIQPDLLIGDFDSVKSELPGDVETVRLKVEKDDTDTFAAVKEGLRRGYRSFVLAGVFGGERSDHSYASLSVLQYLCGQGCKAVMEGDRCRVFLLRGGKLTLRGMKGKTVSIFPFGCVSCEVSYTGLQYPLSRTLLFSDTPLGVSNRAVDDSASVTVHSGDALIMVER